MPRVPDFCPKNTTPPIFYRNNKFVINLIAVTLMVAQFLKSVSLGILSHHYGFFKKIESFF